MHGRRQPASNSGQLVICLVLPVLSASVQELVNKRRSRQLSRHGFFTEDLGSEVDFDIEHSAPIRDAFCRELFDTRYS